MTKPALNLPTIRAKAEAAGGANEIWTMKWDNSIWDSNGEIVVYDEGRPNDQQSEHIANMDPATTIALLDKLEALRAALAAELLGWYSRTDGQKVIRAHYCNNCGAEHPTSADSIPHLPDCPLA